MSNHDIDCAFSNNNFLLSLTHGTKYAHVTCAHKYSTRPQNQTCTCKIHESTALRCNIHFKKAEYVIMWCISQVIRYMEGQRVKLAPNKIDPKSNQPQIKSLYFYVFLFNLIICIVNCVVYLIPNQMIVLLCCLFNLICP